jgi:hypothetical protein
MSGNDDSPSVHPSSSSNVSNSGNVVSLAQSSDSSVLQQLLQQLQRMEQQQQVKEQQMQQQIAALTARVDRSMMSSSLSSPPRVITSSKAGGGADDLSRSPVSSYTKMRSVQRGLQFSTLSEPETDDSEKKEPSSNVTSSVSVGVDGMKLKDILSIVPKYVEPFYADSTKDKGRTVVQFLDSINMVMNTFFTDPNSPHQLTVVRLQLRDGALRWLQGKETALREAAANEGRDLTKQPLSWQDEVEEEFVRAHLGTDLPELWLAQLRALQLGKGKTKTPIELDSQFDTLARHVYPTHTTAELEGSMLLAETYGECVASGQPQLFDRIMEIHTPSTLREWKIALTKQWNAAERVRARKAAQSTSSGQGYRASSEGGWRGGRGGRGWQQQINVGRAPALNAVSARAEGSEDRSAAGENYTVEGEYDDQQLAAMSSGRGGRGGPRGRQGGRGGGGGNGGGSGGANLPPELKKLYSEERCFRCKQIGHRQMACPLPPKPRDQEQVTQVSQSNL